ncbi:hypothetical protein, partial [Acidaminococcus fermentans]|uniref:hypothetical protein n=1 Tax=Acidaminococcus fermentans TaxID=905 RepID=UPI00242B2E60
ETDRPGRSGSGTGDFGSGVDAPGPLSLAEGGNPGAGSLMKNAAGAVILLVRRTDEANDEQI